MPPPPQPWRVCVTRDEEAVGPLTVALRAEGFDPRPCPVLVERAPANPRALEQAACDLDRFEWVICSSARAVRALSQQRNAPWPRHVRAAAVGSHTARALIDAGAPPPLQASADGAVALSHALQEHRNWRGIRVLVLTTPGGRTVAADRLREAGALVTAVDAYDMKPRLAADIASEWQTHNPDAAIIASSRAATTLVAAVGVPGLLALRGLVVMGSGTRIALEEMAIPCVVAERADFSLAARTLARLRDREASSALRLDEGLRRAPRAQESRQDEHGP